MSNKQKLTIGRPTLFQKKFCPMLVDHMSKGFSFTSFAVKAGVSRRTLHDWCRNNPDFQEAYEAGYAAALLFHEKLLIKGIQNRLSGNPTLLIFTLKTRFHREYGSEQNTFTETNKPMDVSTITEPVELARLAGPPEELRKEYLKLIESAQHGLKMLDSIQNNPFDKLQSSDS